MLSKTSTYVKSYDRETKWMNFLNKDDDMLKKYNDIWSKVSNITKKNLTVVDPSMLKVVVNRATQDTFLPCHFLNFS